MAWEVEYTDEFKEWWDTLDEQDRRQLALSVKLLEKYGPTLKFPYSSQINGSRHSHMRELRTQSKGRPLRTLYAFDPRRTAILLIGGDKQGNDDWYATYVPWADELYDIYLRELSEE